MLVFQQECRAQIVGAAETKEKQTDVGSMFLLGGAVLGALFVKKQIEERKESAEIERRKKVNSLLSRN